MNCPDCGENLIPKKEARLVPRWYCASCHWDGFYDDDRGNSPEEDWINRNQKGRKMSTLDQKIAELKSAGVNLTYEQEKVLRESMLDFAFCACIDSSIRKEVEEEFTGYTEGENDIA